MPRTLICSLLAIPLLLLQACGDPAPEQVDSDSGTASAAETSTAPVPPPRASGSLVAAETEVVVTAGVDSTIEFLEAENWWGTPTDDEPLQVPHLLVTRIKPSWQEASQALPVQQKKAFFYRLMLPLVMHANSMVAEFRRGLEQARKELDTQGKVSPESLALLQRLAGLLPGETREYMEALESNTPELEAMIESLLYRLDEVPPGLALGQAAYESGYGTSRFAVEGHSLFGQWTYKDDGIKPKEQRASKGNHQIKAFEWPFDSVRGYFINLMTHPAYEDFRHLRAQLRAEGKPLDSLVLADGLLSYSERGAEYVDSLKGMIRHNHLYIADHAVLRDEPIRFLLTEESEEAAQQTRDGIEAMRASGEMQEILERMRLE
ncbi:hypothetical protein FV139_04685 [Parahaliea maris]|uniref:Mannosyl-glycoprotein endo-beta-N-acetylglucosamidase-like domain-containing protein n=1 Tax=Parahaliea maris TaxID=2716870 RepID=A0A5C9A7K2_9GAMM|nr:glucosaminidase domain-containing protein [Parahaliea maris]TXS95201.1 hypothetical protein FV139_04685 [Parahaliea maris]